MNPALINPQQWVDAYGDMLYAYAYKTVSREDVVENLVQETFLAALESRHRFEGRSTERTWLIGILRNKILQYLKNKYRVVSETDLKPEGVDEGSFFDHMTGMWKNEPSDWELPADEKISKKEFWGIFNSCLEGLPPQAAQAFMLREMNDLGTEEIAGTLNVSESNVFVILHRARLRLRACLEKNWFKAGGHD